MQATSPDVEELNRDTLEGVSNVKSTPTLNPFRAALAAMSDQVKTLNPSIVEELEEAARTSNRGAGNKFNAQVTITDDGKKFPSRKEANEYLALRLLERAGVISRLELQPKFVLQRANKKKGVKQVKYTPDFKYLDNQTGRVTIIETKGVKTADFIVRHNLFVAWLKEHHADWVFIVK